MRLSGLFVIVVLLISFPLFAQHSSSAPAAPSTPPPSAPASTSSATSSSSAPSAGAGASHVASAPAPATGSASQPSSSSTSGHASAASSSESNSSRSGSAERSSDPDVRHSNDPKHAENDRIVSSPRIGERLGKDEKETKEKPASDLRKKICVEGRCEECPSGEAGKNGNCVPISVMTEDPCASSIGRAATSESDVRTARTRMQNVCATDPSGDECDDLKQQYDGAVQRYRGLLNQAPASCRALLPDPLAL